MRASEAHEAVVNDDTVRRQSRRETERRSARTCSSRSQTCFYKRNMAAKFFYFTRIAIIYPLFCCGRSRTPALQPPDILPRYPSAFAASRRHHTRIIFREKIKRVSPTVRYRYPSAFPWGKGDRVAVDEGNLYHKSKRDNVKILRIMN